MKLYNAPLKAKASTAYSSTKTTYKDLHLLSVAAFLYRVIEFILFVQNKKHYVFRREEIRDGGVQEDK